MKKIITSVVFVSLLSIGISPAVATQEPSIVIIDSGFNTSLISNNVVEEVCITVNSGCNNGSNLHVGPGASGSATNISSRFVSDWNHGTLMAQEAIAVNPNINLILIRNSRVMSSGNVLFGGEAALESTLRWVSDNAERYNIVGVSMSRGSHTYVLNNAVARKQLTYLQVYNSQLEKMNGQPQFRASIASFTKRLQDATAVMNALPDIACPASNTLRSLVSQLVQKDIATIFATGNDSNTRYVDSPACIDDAIAVAASDASGKTLSKSNTAPNTDFTTTAPNTSVAAVRLASKWSLMYNGSYNLTYNSIVSSGSSSHSWSAIFVP
jgi:hypothetical protein